MIDSLIERRELTLDKQDYLNVLGNLVYKISGIAQLLKIPKYLIVRVECWAYVIFVHRTDKGGQFISYRKLQQWRNAVASQIQNCATFEEIHLLWSAIENDYVKYNQQYDEK